MEDLRIYAHDRDAAVAQARDAFDSWNERGQPGDAPQGQFGDSEYLRMSTSSSSKRRRQIVENDRGYGLEASLIKGSRNPSSLWFHAAVGEYQREWLERVVSGEAETGVIEFRFDESGQLWAYVSVSEEIEVYEPADVDTTLAVDFGERILWAAAVVGSDGVETVEMEAGREFRHYREQLKRRREELSEAGDLAGVRQTRGDRERYTEQEVHTATRRIVDLAAEHAPCKIRYEDLSDYRETATDPIHDWPHGMLTSQLAYKATEAGLPVEAIDPAGTSITCRKCGVTNDAYRDGDNWHCRDCGYEVHADVNAALNIAE
jgi:IS605 OrfB family transposase